MWIEGSVSKSKTAMGARARLLLPLLAPCVYLETPWIPQWLEARISLGLSVKGAIDKGSLIPHFGEDGVPTGNAMSSQQITKWLRGILAEVSPDSSRLSSHSLKATGLTWAASAGVAIDTRRLLAHHVHDSARSTETYSRDVLAPAARIFEEVLLAIRDGDFVPDNPRGSQIRTRQACFGLQQTRSSRAGGSSASEFECSSRPGQRGLSSCVGRAAGARAHD